MSLLEQFAPDANVTVTPAYQGDLWADTPFFAPGMLEDSENKAAWPQGVKIAGIFKGLRTKKEAGPKTVPTYGIFETRSGLKFRVDAPGSLRHTLENAAIGTYLVMEYLGKEYVESLKSECHKFDIGIGEGTLN